MVNETTITEKFVIPVEENWDDWIGDIYEKCGIGNHVYFCTHTLEIFVGNVHYRVVQLDKRPQL